MILSVEQASLFYVPKLANDLHLSLINNAPLFYNYVPFLKIENNEWRRSYRLEADITDNTQYTSPLLPEATPIDVSAMPVHTYGSRPRTRQAQWKLTKLVYPFTEDADEDLAGTMVNQHLDNIYTNLEMIGSNIVVDIIRRGAVVPANRVGGIVANLSSWDNTTPSFTQGYSADVLTQQQITHSGTIWGWDATSTGVTADDITVLDRAIARCNGQASAIIVPERFIWAMTNSYMRRGFSVPNILLDIQRFGTTQPTKVQAYQYKGVPFVPIPDLLYTAAGHDVTSTPGDYDIYVIKSAQAGNPFGGAAINFKGKMEVDSPDSVNVGSSTMSLGTGITLEKHGKLVDETGIRDAYVREMSARWQFTLGTPQSASVIVGVQD
jgi:hypothetical protein